MSVDAINKLLTKESGLLGLTEVTSDCRYVEDNYATKKTRSAQWTFTATARQIHRCLHCADGWSSDAVYSPVVSVKMPRWFVNCLWANWACWALKLIMNATRCTFRQIWFHQQRRYPSCGGYPNQRRTGYRARREPPDCSDFTPPAQLAVQLCNPPNRR